MKYNEFFSYKLFADNQILDAISLQKGKNEVRVISIAYVFADTVNKYRHTQLNIQCVSGHLIDNKLERHWDYLECYEVINMKDGLRKIKELYYSYQANYIIMDLRNGGELLYDELVNMGFSIAIQKELHIVTDVKIQDLESRSNKFMNIPCIIPILGTVNFNSAIWFELKKSLEDGKCKFLDVIGPYEQTHSMIFEAITLEPKLRNDKIKLVEPRNGGKDRIYQCAWTNYIMSKIEAQLNK